MDKIDIDTATKLATAAGAGGIIASFFAWIFGKRKRKTAEELSYIELIEKKIAVWQKLAEDWEERAAQADKRAAFWESKAEEWKNTAIGLEKKLKDLEKTVEENSKIIKGE